MKSASTYAGLTARQALEECRKRRRYGYPRPFDHPGFSNLDSAAELVTRMSLYTHPAGNWMDDRKPHFIRPCLRCGGNFISGQGRLWCKQCEQETQA